jgi:hypothetical protein
MGVGLATRATCVSFFAAEPLTDLCQGGSLLIGETHVLVNWFRYVRQ